MRPQDIVTIVVATVIFAVTLVLLVFALSKHDEPGLLAVCWEDGKAHYTGCQTPTEPLQWNKRDFPLRVAVLPVDNQPTTEGESTARLVVRDWNSQLRFQAFAPELVQPSEANVFLFYGTAYDPSNHEGGDTSHRMLRNRMQASVHVASVSTNVIEYRILFHEMGHVLGLAHDPFPASAMYPNTLESSEDDLVLMTVTQDDKKLLRHLYR